MNLTINPIQIVKSNPATTANVTSLQMALFAATTRSEIEKINPNVMVSLTSGQIASLSTAQQSYFTGEQLSKLSVEAWDGFKSTAVALFNDGQVRSLGKNFVLSGSNGKLACLPADKLKMLSSEAVRSIQAKNIYRLSSAQLDAVINNNIRNTAGFPSELSAEAVSGITGTNILGVSPDSIKLLNPDVISSLPLVVLNQFDDLKIKALTNTQVAKLSMRQVLTLSNAQKSAMSAYQLRSLSKEGWEGFKATQVSEISAEKIPYLGTNFIKGINTYTCPSSNGLRQMG